MNTGRTLHAGEVGFLAILAAVGAALRLYRLDTGLWFDEIVTLLDSVRHPLGHIVTHFPSNNDHPLYSVLAHLSVSASGESPWALRLPSVLLGVAAIPLLYVVGAAVTTRLEAGAAALILTVSYHHVWFSQNARGYTALLFCVLLSTHALVRWHQTGRRPFLLLYAVVTAAGAYAHLTMVLVSVSHALAFACDWLIHGRASRARLEWKPLAGGFAGAAVLTVLCYAPMLLDVSAFFTTQTATANEVATPVWAMLAVVRGLQAGFGTIWVVLLGGVVFAAGAWSYFRQQSTVALLFLLPLPVTVLLAVAMDRPIFPRFVFFAAGLLLLVAVRGAAVAGTVVAGLAHGRLSPPQGARIAVGLVTLAAVALSVRSLPYGYRYPKQDYERAVAFVEASAGSTAPVALVGDTAAIPVVQYLGKPWPRVDDAHQLRQLRAGGAPAWVVYTFPSYIEAGQPELWRMLQTECTEAAEFEGTVAGGTITVRRCG